MDRIHYAGDSVLTGTAIAKALLEYAEALAKNDASATVEIPTRLDDGLVGRSTFLVGPASQLVSDCDASDYEEIVDQELVDFFRSQTDRLRLEAKRTATAVPSTDQPDAEQIGWLEDL